MSKQSVMIRDVEDIMIFADEKVEEISRSGFPLREMTNRQCYEISCALDNVFGNSEFVKIPNGRRIFDHVWATVENDDDSMQEVYRRFCMEAQPYLEVARMAAMLD